MALASSGTAQALSPARTVASTLVGGPPDVMALAPRWPPFHHPCPWPARPIPAPAVDQRPRGGCQRGDDSPPRRPEERRERFWEALEIILKAWTEERFSYTGKHYTVNDVCVLPKPYQKPHPPIRIAATTRETFPQIGRLGFPIFVGLRGFDVPEVAYQLGVYRKEWQEAGYLGYGDVYLRIPVYVAETAAQARTEPQVSTMRSYRRLAESFATSAGAAGTSASEERFERADRLARTGYDALLRDRLAYGTPEMVAERLAQLRDELGLAGVIIEPNVGGYIPRELVFKSVRLFAQEVVPRLR